VKHLVAWAPGQRSLQRAAVREQRLPGHHFGDPGQRLGRRRYLDDGTAVLTPTIQTARRQRQRAMLTTASTSNWPGEHAINPDNGSQFLSTTWCRTRTHQRRATMTPTTMASQHRGQPTPAYDTVWDSDGDAHRATVANGPALRRRKPCGSAFSNGFVIWPLGG
jgi:hypothetical protein